MTTTASRLIRQHQVIETLDANVGDEVVLAGWVHKRRDFGSVVFVDLRDRSGIVQLVFDHGLGTPEPSMEVANRLRNEYVIIVRGTVRNRDESAINPKLATGSLEVIVTEAVIENAAKNPPFYIQDGIDVDETLRLRYRYLDLRRPEMQKIMMVRHQVIRAFRAYLDEHGFVEMETPILTKSTPEGARDYLVPSRLQSGEFYALPQSPQIFKQLLMLAGMERYYQVARCFRDEDLRADRQPEFTQLDIETSFLTAEQLQTMMEEMLQKVLKDTVGMDLQIPFQRLPYQEAMERYGSDKPDLRFDMAFVDLADVVKDSEFRVFQDAIAAGGTVKALVAPGIAGYSRKQTDELVEFVKTYGLKGLATVAVQEGGTIKSSISKFFTEEQLANIVQTCGAQAGDLILIAAAGRKEVLVALGALRVKLGNDLGLADPNTYKFLWVTDFPLLSYDEEEGRFVAEHHPFTMPKYEDVELLATNPEKVRAEAYDIVLNGYEIGGGSMRIYRRDIQEQMFTALGFSKEEAYEKFGFLLDAFEYGAPPHGGIAFGLDRIIMLLGGGKSLRDCIAFPKTASGTDLMMDAPATVSEEQLKILHLALRD
ncbi:aspartate--tRNA ligase [Alicyclobacillus dauci]|uniref:Aspartate--tRNA ligase n=1 Tax=Alicyclobacillus dauci TaxID=1475485 RepID=A0ABY6Z6G9_9BACL|nr:aspartate--tRNA ligase [Alicyclobacillus dauci]WAH38498.1 aspartate--tRNA ligase [Alicyclobacillus dauci]